MTFLEILNYFKMFEGLSYLGMYIFLGSAGHFIPIPEDIALMIAGYLTSLGHLKLWPMLLVSILGPITGDSILFWLSKKGSRFTRKIEEQIKNEVFEFVKKRMMESTVKTMFVMRFIPGLRFASPVVAGYVGIPWKKFLPINILSAIFFGPTFLLIGYIFHQKILGLVDAAETVRHAIFVVLILVLFIAAYLAFHRRFLKTKI